MHRTVVTRGHRGCIDDEGAFLHRQDSGGGHEVVVVGTQTSKHWGDDVIVANRRELTAGAGEGGVVGIQAVYHTHTIAALIAADGIGIYVRFAIHPFNVIRRNGEGGLGHCQVAIFLGDGVIVGIRAAIQFIQKCIGMGVCTHISISSTSAEVAVGGTFTLHKAAAAGLYTVPSHSSGIIHFALRHGDKSHIACSHCHDTGVQSDAVIVYSMCAGDERDGEIIAEAAHIGDTRSTRVGRGNLHGITRTKLVLARIAGQRSHRLVTESHRIGLVGDGCSAVHCAGGSRHNSQLLVGAIDIEDTWCSVFHIIAQHIMITRILHLQIT